MPQQPFIVRLTQPPPAHDTTLLDVVVGSVGVVGAGILIAVVCGGLLGLVFVRWNRRRAGAPSRPPSISPFAGSPSVTDDSVPPSSPAR